MKGAGVIRFRHFCSFQKSRRAEISTFPSFLLSFLESSLDPADRPLPGLISVTLTQRLWTMPGLNGNAREIKTVAVLLGGL